MDKAVNKEIKNQVYGEDPVILRAVVSSGITRVAACLMLWLRFKVRNEEVVRTVMKFP